MNDTLRIALIAIVAVVVAKLLSARVPALAPVGQFL